MRSHQRKILKNTEVQEMKKALKLKELKAYNIGKIARNEKFIFAEKSKRNHYYVSSYGRVISQNIKSGQLDLLKQNDNGRGYLQVKINNKNKYVHTLVAQAFCGCQYDDYKDCKVHHLNKISKDNRADNLVWLSQKHHDLIHTILDIKRFDDNGQTTYVRYAEQTDILLADVAKLADQLQIPLPLFCDKLAGFGTKSVRYNGIKDKIERTMIIKILDRDMHIESIKIDGQCNCTAYIIIRINDTFELFPPKKKRKKVK